MYCTGGTGTYASDGLRKHCVLYLSYDVLVSKKKGKDFDCGHVVHFSFIRFLVCMCVCGQDLKHTSINLVNQRVLPAACLAFGGRAMPCCGHIFARSRRPLMRGLFCFVLLHTNAICFLYGVLFALLLLFGLYAVSSKQKTGKLKL